MAEGMKEDLYRLVLTDVCLRWEPEGMNSECRRRVLSEMMDSAFFISCLLYSSDRHFC